MRERSLGFVGSDRCHHTPSGGENSGCCGVGEMSGRAQREHKKVEAFSIEVKEKEEFVIKPVRASRARVAVLPPCADPGARLERRAPARAWLSGTV